MVVEDCQCGAALGFHPGRLDDRPTSCIRQQKISQFPGQDHILGLFGQLYFKRRTDRDEHSLGPRRIALRGKMASEFSLKERVVYGMRSQFVQHTCQRRGDGDDL